MIGTDNQIAACRDLACLLQEALSEAKAIDKTEVDAGNVVAAIQSALHALALCTPEGPEVGEDANNDRKVDAAREGVAS